MRENKRISWIDFGKGFTIFLVVIAHALGGVYTNGIYNGGINTISMVIGESLFLIIMPVFFSLSGYLYKVPKNFNSYFFMLKKKAWNLLIPYAIFSLIYVLMNQVGGKDNKYSWDSLLYIYITPISYLWFLYILFFIFVLVGALSLLNLSINIQIWIYLLAFIFISLNNFHIYLFNTFGWAFFFCLGTFFKENIVFLKRKACLYSSMVVTIAYLITLFLILGLSHKYYNSLTMINFIPKVISDVFMFSLFLSLSEHTKLFAYFKKYGKNSLIIYMIHAPLLSASRIIILKFGIPNELILIIILVMISWYGSIFVIWLSNKNTAIRFIFNAYATVHPNKKYSS